MELDIAWLSARTFLVVEEQRDQERDGSRESDLLYLKSIASKGVVWFLCVLEALLSWMDGAVRIRTPNHPNVLTPLAL